MNSLRHRRRRSTVAAAQEPMSCTFAQDHRVYSPPTQSTTEEKPVQNQPKWSSKACWETDRAPGVPFMLPRTPVNESVFGCLCPLKLRPLSDPRLPWRRKPRPPTKLQLGLEGPEGPPAPRWPIQSFRGRLHRGGADVGAHACHFLSVIWDYENIFLLISLKQRSSHL